MGQTVKKIDSIKTVLNNAPKDTLYVETLNDLGLEYFFAGDFDKCRLYAQQALNLSEELNYDWGIVSSYYRIGLSYNEQNNYTKALEYFNLSLNKGKELGYIKIVPRSLVSIGNVYEDITDYPKAMEYYLKALEIYKNHGEDALLAGILHNIALIYLNENDYSKALEKFFQVLKIQENLNNSEGIAQAENNIAVCYYHQKKYPESLIYYLKTLKHYQKTENYPMEFLLFTNIGDVYNMMGEYKLAREYFLKANTLKNGSYQTNENKILLYKNWGDLFFNQQQYKKAITYYDSSLAISKNINNLIRILESEKALSETYEKLNEPVQALEHYKQYSIFNDSIYNEKKSEQIVEMQTKYEILEKEKEQEKKELEYRARLKQQQIYTYSSIAGLVGVSVFIVLLYKRNKLKQRIKITEQQRELNQLTWLLKEENFKNSSLEKKIVELEQKKVTIQNPDELANKIRAKISIERNWLDFMTQFNILHPGFIENLQNKYPQLSNNDLRLLTLLKLKIDTKEIASILLITPSSVVTSKYRIKKKMGDIEDVDSML